MAAHKKPRAKRNARLSKANKPPFNSNYKDWADKQEVMNHFHFSDRTLQNLRNKNIIVWSKLGGKIYYHLPTFAARLDENRRG